MINVQEGKIITALGIPGSGKSTTTNEIGKLLNIKTYHEPEEEEWGEAVKMRNQIGNFTSIMWFRSARVPLLYLAEEQRKQGKTVMLDSYYDKLFHLYCNKKGIEWLFNDSDLYYEEMISIASKDYKYLPNSDIIVFFKIDELNWSKFIKIRNRNLDNDLEFQKSFVLQQAMLDAAKHYCNETNCKLIIHNQSFSTPKTEAQKIALKLQNIL